MDDEQLKSALAAALAEGWPERTGYVLSLLAYSLAGAARPLHARASADPAAAKLSALGELQYVITGRLVDLFSYRDEWSEADFVGELYEVAQRGGCEGELNVQAREVLTVIELRQQRARDD